MSWDDLGVELNAWPKVSEVKAYRRHVRELVLSLIDTCRLMAPSIGKALVGDHHGR